MGANHMHEGDQDGTNTGRVHDKVLGEDTRR